MAVTRLSDLSSLTAATDGSGDSVGTGWAWFASEHLYDFGGGQPGAHHELDAIAALLDAVPSTLPLRVLTDCSEAFLRLVEGLPPDPARRHARQWLDVMDVARPRPVTMVLVGRDTGEVPLEHAMAHYLAFLGRTGRRRTPGEPAPGFARISAAPDPDAEAHAMVVEHLFPTRGRR